MDVSNLFFDGRYSHYETSINKIDSTDDQNEFDPGIESIRGFRPWTWSEWVKNSDFDIDNPEVTNIKVHRKNKKLRRQKVMV